MSSNQIEKAAFRAPVQRRSRESLERVYAAINALLLEKNFDQVTMAELSRRANVTIGSIYQRFGSKDELLWIMYGSYLSEVSQKIEGLLNSAATLPLEERVEILISLIFDLFQTHTGVIRSLLMKHRQDPGSVPERYRAQIEGAFDSAARFLMDDKQEEFSNRALLLAVSVMISTSRELILFHDYQWSSPQKVEKPEFVAALKSAMLGILNTRGL